MVWKSATTCHIPNVCPPKDIETDLRSISLTCIISKELETHKMGWLWRIVWPKIGPYQFAAVARCLKVHAVVEMMHEWYSGTDNNRDRNYIQVVIVDYSKSFDRIVPTIMLEKLKSFNIPTFLLLHWICD